MGIERRQGTVYQLSLLEWGEEAVRPGVPGEGGTGTGANEDQQGPTASERKRALPEALMEEVIEPKNLNRACQRVKANKGAPGVDGMSVDDLGGWLAEHREELVASLLEGSYQPQPVRGVEIPKPGGGVRQLGIPTVVDRLVQQGILQVLDPLLDPTFSESSYGFRPGRNAHQALILRNRDPGFESLSLRSLFIANLGVSAGKIWDASTRAYFRTQSWLS